MMSNVVVSMATSLSCRNSKPTRTFPARLNNSVINALGDRAPRRPGSDQQKGNKHMLRELATC